MAFSRVLAAEGANRCGAPLYFGVALETTHRWHHASFLRDGERRLPRNGQQIAAMMHMAAGQAAAHRQAVDKQWEGSQRSPALTRCLWERCPTASMVMPNTCCAANGKMVTRPSRPLARQTQCGRQHATKRTMPRSHRRLGPYTRRAVNVCLCCQQDVSFHCCPEGNRQQRGGRRPERTRKRDGVQTRTPRAARVEASSTHHPSMETTSEPCRPTFEPKMYCAITAAVMPVTFQAGSNLEGHQKARDRTTKSASSRMLLTCFDACGEVEVLAWPPPVGR